MREGVSTATAPLARLATLTAVSALLAGCAAGMGPKAPSAGVPRVLAAETFLADIAQNVAGDRLVVESLLPVGVDPHEFQATPQDAIKISESDVLIVNGLGYEAWLSKTLGAGAGDQLTITATDGVAAGQDADPHRWMNPRDVVSYVEVIRDGLAQADPGGWETYAANAEAYSQQLRDLDAWVKAEVAVIPAGRRVLITNHHALESFAAAYGFQIAGVVIPGFTSEAAPSAREMADLISTIRSKGAPAIFLDVSENPNLARQLAGESSAVVITGLYIETLSAADGPAPTYIQMIKHDVQLIVEALR
jgi:zinc/manganese transport system substrate-binding protein